MQLVSSGCLPPLLALLTDSQLPDHTQERVASLTLEAVGVRSGVVSRAACLRLAYAMCSMRSPQLSAADSVILCHVSCVVCLSVGGPAAAEWAAGAGPGPAARPLWEEGACSRCCGGDVHCGAHGAGRVAGLHWAHSAASRWARGRSAGWGPGPPLAVPHDMSYSHWLNFALVSSESCIAHEMRTAERCAEDFMLLAPSAGRCHCVTTYSAGHAAAAERGSVFQTHCNVVAKGPLSSQAGS